MQMPPPYMCVFVIIKVTKIGNPSFMYNTQFDVAIVHVVIENTWKIADLKIRR